MTMTTSEGGAALYFLTRENDIQWSAEIGVGLLTHVLNCREWRSCLMEECVWRLSHLRVCSSKVLAWEIRNSGPENSTSSRDLSTDQRIHFFLLIASPGLLASSTTWIRSGRNKLDPSACAKQLLFSKTTLYSILTKPKRGKCPFRKRKEMLALFGHNVMEFADFLKHAAGGGEPRETTELQSLWLTDYHLSWHGALGVIVTEDETHPFGLWRFWNWNQMGSN